MNDLNRYTNLKFLVIDDFADFRSSIRDMITALGGKHIDLAPDAQRALALYKAHRHHIILCDYNLGEGKDGQQLLEELNYREILRKDSIFVMVTAETSSKLVMGALEYSPDDYLTKPFTKQTLKTRLDRIYQRKQVLKPILLELNRHNYQKAISASNQLISNKCKYLISCLKMKGDCLLRLGQYKQAANIYQQILDNRALLWALMGLAKCEVELAEYENAIEHFHQIIEANPFAVEAFDHKAEAFAALGEYHQAELALKLALKISDKSINRYRRLGFYAEKSKHYSTMVDAYRLTVHKGKNSIALKEEDVLHYLNALCFALPHAKGKMSVQLNDEFSKELLSFQKHYANEPQMCIAFKLIKAQYYQAMNKPETVTAAISEISQDFTQQTAIRGFLRDQLSYFQSHYPNLAQMSANLKLTIKQQCLITNEDAHRAAEYHQKGLKLIEQKDMNHAIAAFKQGFLAASSNISLALGLMASLLKQFEQSGQTNEQDIQVLELCVRTAKNIDPADQRYTLFRQHLKTIRTLL